LPLGSGLGSFQQLYQLREPPETIGHAVVNHAHNDWLEVALELGLPGVALAAAFLIWLALSIRRAASLRDSEYNLTRAALIALVLLITHSIWDYPLRTVAMSAIFGLCCGLIYRPGENLVQEQQSDRRRRHKRSSGRKPVAVSA
jgi:O-antigen ligase